MNIIEFSLTNSTTFTFIQFDLTQLLCRMNTPKNTPNYIQNGLWYGMGKIVFVNFEGFLERIFCVI